MKQLLKTKAIKLRKEGYLYAHIAQELNIAKSTAYLWTRGVELSKEQASKVSGNRFASRQLVIKKMAAVNRERRLQRDALIQKQAYGVVRERVLSLNTKKILCASLFWCEGGKDITSGVKFINSDPVMIHAFLTLLRECFDIKESKLRALIHLHEYHDPEKQLAYWSKITKIPIGQFHKPYSKPHTGKNIHENYPGCVSIRYGDVQLGKTLKMIYSELGKSI